MGQVTFGAPKSTIIFLKNTFKISTFIETGTHKGATSGWASTEFEQVITIEGSREFYEEAKPLHSENQNISFRFGDSRTELKAILNEIKQPALFWLDAHYMAIADVFGREAECPVLDEISMLIAHNPQHVILIDDARFFLAPPAPPHNPYHWPTISDIMQNLMGRYNVIYDDVIISVQKEHRDVVQTYFQHVVENQNKLAFMKANTPMAKIGRFLANRFSAPQ